MENLKRVLVFGSLLSLLYTGPYYSDMESDFISWNQTGAPIHVLEALLLLAFPLLLTLQKLLVLPALAEISHQLLRPNYAENNRYRILFTF